jgi:hypothetical protein
MRRKKITKTNMKKNMINTGKEWGWMDQNDRHPHGFLPKISYWMGQWEDAVVIKDETRMKFCETKLFYFMGRQLQINKDI